MIPTQNETSTSETIKSAAASPAERIASEVGTEMGRQMGEAVGAAAGQAAARLVEETVDQVKREATQRFEDVKERALGPMQNAAGQVRELTRLYPLPAVGCAVGLGYFVGCYL